MPTHGTAPLERSASTPPVTHNGKPLPPADGPPLSHSPKLQHVGKGPHPRGNNPKYANLRASAEADEALKVSPNPNPNPNPYPYPNPNPNPNPNPKPQP